jgi:argininosuccinate lyase
MQDRRRQSARLGFREPVQHARDAMWQPDLAIEAVCVAVTATVNLDRLAEDLMVFASAEFGFIHLADRHARASKIMPQKRNPFALAFLRATANRLIGVQAGTAAANRTLSGQVDNRIFAYGDVPDALRSAAEAISLLAECIDGLSVDTTRAAALLDDRSTCATDLAERLMAATSISYRDAHGVVGRLIRTLEECGRSLADATISDVLQEFHISGLPVEGISDEVIGSALDLVAGIAARTDVGGAAVGEVTAMADSLATAVRGCQQGFKAARENREAAIGLLLSNARTVAGCAR